MDDDAKKDWYSDDSATFGDRLADARQAIGLDQREFARRLGVKLTTLEAWENDTAEPRANRLSMMAGILGVSLRWLMTGEGDGLEPPAADAPTEIADILTEMRQVRAEMVRASDRLGKLEKRLRLAQQSVQA